MDHKQFISPYKKQIIELARMNHYQPIASIHPPSNHFNYTIKANILQKKQQPIDPHQPLRKIIKKMQPFKLPKLTRQPSPTNKFITLDTRIDSKMTEEEEEPKNQPKPLSISPSYIKKYIHQSYCEEQESEEEYIKDSTPGPGHYPLHTNSFKKTEKTTSGNFGGNSKRFTNIQKQTKSMIVMEESPSVKRVKQNKVSFNSKIARFQNTKHDLKYSPGPLDYNPRISIEEDLIRKIQRNFKGSFGIVEKRFTPLQQLDPIGPGRYNPQLTYQEDNIRPSHYFRSRIPRLQ